MQVLRGTVQLERQKSRTPEPRPSLWSDLSHGFDNLTSWRRWKKIQMMVRTVGTKEMTETKKESREGGSWGALQLHLGKRRQQASF